MASNNLPVQNQFNQYLAALQGYAPTSSYGTIAPYRDPNMPDPSTGQQLLNTGLNQGVKYGVGSLFGSGSAGAGTAIGESTTGIGAEMLGGGATQSAPLMGVGALPLLGIAGGLALGGKGIKDLLAGKSGSGWEGKGGRATLGIATGGLSEVARGLGLFGGKSTQDYQNERWGALSPELQKLRLANHPEKDDGIWDTGKYAGQKWSFDKALDLAKSDPAQFAGVLGNLETFGEDFTKLDADKRNALVGRLANEGFYHSNKGDVLISDKKQEEARRIYNEIVNPQINKPATVLSALSGTTQPLVIK